MSTMDKITVISKGIFHASKMNCCKTMATKNKRKAAPRTLDKKKKKAPARWLFFPNRAI